MAVDGLMKLRERTEQTRQPPAELHEVAVRPDVGQALQGEAFAGEAQVASVAQALLEEENKELREELRQRDDKPKVQASLLSSGSSTRAAEAQAQWKLVAFLQVSMVVVTAMVIGVMYWGTRNAPKDRLQPRYGSADTSVRKVKRATRSPAGVVDEDEEQQPEQTDVQDVHFAPPVWSRP
ncbi:unnamed protein product [Effrenium voratum]|nr:unnamed protein product [Effrenium voratum]CAJ1439755.1 unnamed protein product [Effrenium voratum]